jgi:hypothetical protein
MVLFGGLLFIPFVGGPVCVEFRVFAFLWWFIPFSPAVESLVLVSSWVTFLSSVYASFPYFHPPPVFMTFTLLWKSITM